MSEKAIFNLSIQGRDGQHVVVLKDNDGVHETAFNSRVGAGRYAAQILYKTLASLGGTSHLRHKGSPPVRAYETGFWYWHRFVCPTCGQKFHSLPGVQMHHMLKQYEEWHIDNDQPV